MRRCQFHGTALLFLTLSLSSCQHQASKRETKSEGSTVNAAAPAPEIRASETSSPANVADRGDFKLQYEPRKSPKKSAAAHQVGGTEQPITRIIGDLNQKVALPFDIILAVKDCDLPDAYYDPDTHKVVVCYQLIDQYYDMFGLRLKDAARLDETVRGATAATFFHELGHALVDAWKLPITGKEEDAVDQLSTLVLINKSEEGERMALAGAVSFKLYADLSNGQKKIYWDEHSLDEQRFYDTVCMIYGHNPQKYEYLVTEGTLPDERAVNCPPDYERIARSWKTLLAPYLK